MKINNISLDGPQINQKFLSILLENFGQFMYYLFGKW